MKRKHKTITLYYYYSRFWSSSNRAISNEQTNMDDFKWYNWGISYSNEHIDDMASYSWKFSHPITNY